MNEDWIKSWRGRETLPNWKLKIQKTKNKKWTSNLKIVVTHLQPSQGSPMPGLAMTQTTSQAWYKLLFDLQLEFGFEFDAGCLPACQCSSSSSTWFAVRVRVRRNRLWAALRLGPVSEQAAFVSAFSLQRSARCSCTQCVAYRKSSRVESRELEINEWDKQQLTTRIESKSIQSIE